MQADGNTELPIRAGVFGDPDHVEQALNELRVNDFSVEEISVVTAVPEHQERFAPYLEQSHSGSDVENKSLARAGAAGLGLGGAAALTTTLVTTEGAAVLVLGAFSGIALLGTFVALMMTRGIEKETADFFDQELTKGNILVAIEEHGENQHERLALAERILQDAGSKPIDLVEG